MRERRRHPDQEDRDPRSPRGPGGVRERDDQREQEQDGDVVHVVLLLDYDAVHRRVRQVDLQRLPVSPSSNET